MGASGPGGPVTRIRVPDAPPGSRPRAPGHPPPGGCDLPRPVTEATGKVGPQMDPKHQRELSPEELEGEIAEALPERAAMSTVSMTGLDAATGTVEAVSDGVTESAAATGEPETATTAAPEPVESAPEAAP